MSTAVETRAIAPKIDYYTSLSRAVARLDHDSFEARGAIYDRNYVGLVKRIAAADPPYSDDEIAWEKRAFRDAIRRIEFGDFDEPGVPVASPEIAPAAAPPDEIDQVPDIDQTLATVPAQNLTWNQVTRRKRPADATVAKPVARRQRGSISRRVGRRMLFAAAVLVMGAGGYGLLINDVGLPWLSKLPSLPQLPWLSQFIGNGVLSGGSGDAQKVVLFFDDPSKPDGKKALGNVNWRIRPEPAGNDRKPVAVLQVDVEIPERGLTLALSMRPELQGVGTMSHLIELKFQRADKQPFDDIVDIAGMVMTTEDQGRRAVIAGQVVKVTPGVFLFGLSGAPVDQQRNRGFLKELPWLDIPISYRDGTLGVLAIEKGAAGERGLNEVLGP